MKTLHYSFRTNYSVTSHAFVLEGIYPHNLIEKKKKPLRLNLLTGSLLYYKTIKCEKNFCLFFSYIVQRRRCITQRTDNFEYSQMTSNPAFTERNIQKANAYLLYSRQEQKSLVTYHTLQSLYVCVWLVNTLTSTAPIGSPIICIWSPADICEQWKRNLSFDLADVSGTPENVCLKG